LAVLVGLHPGENLALRWGRVDWEMAHVAECVYRGLLDDPKTERGKRQAAVPPDLAADIMPWHEISGNTKLDDLVFPSERGTFLSRDKFLRWNTQKKLATIGRPCLFVNRLPKAQPGNAAEPELFVLAISEPAPCYAMVGVWFRSQGNPDVAVRRCSFGGHGMSWGPARKPKESNG